MKCGQTAAPQNRAYVFQAETPMRGWSDCKCKFASEITENVDVPNRTGGCRQTAQGGALKSFGNSAIRQTTVYQTSTVPIRSGTRSWIAVFAREIPQAARPQQ